MNTIFFSKKPSVASFAALICLNEDFFLNAVINCFPDSVQEVKRALMEYPSSGTANPGRDEEPA